MEKVDHLALLDLVWQGPDEAAAAAVAAFAGDINRKSHGNAGGRFKGYTALAVCMVVAGRLYSRSKTLDALAARGDVDVHQRLEFPLRLTSATALQNISTHAHALRPVLPAFLRAFSSESVEACTEALYTPCKYAFGTEAALMLLDAGAAVTPAHLSLAQTHNLELAAVLQPHADWAAGLRRCWMQACVSLVQ